VRGAAAISLGRLREPRAIDPLIAMLARSDLGERSAAADGLRTIGAGRAALVDLLERVGPRRSGSALLSDIGDARASMRWSACPGRPARRLDVGRSAAATTQHERAERLEVRVAALVTSARWNHRRAHDAREGAHDPSPRCATRPSARSRGSAARRRCGRSRTSGIAPRSWKRSRS